jgi:hypothetical protein
MIKWNYEKKIENNFCLTPLDSVTIIIQQFLAQRIPEITILQLHTADWFYIISYFMLDLFLIYLVETAAAW